MTAPVTHDIELRGCTPEPLMSYLKALGILRLIHEQKDQDVRGWWKNEVFQLRTRLSKDEIISFFLEEYKPTPIVGPWGKDSEFFSRDITAIQEIKKSSCVRLKDYRETIDQVYRIFREENISKKIADNQQNILIRRCRNELPDSAANWVDAVFVIQSNTPKCSILLGRGNDGRLNFSNCFVKRIQTLFLEKPDYSKDLLEFALYGYVNDRPISLQLDRVGQYSPGRLARPNSPTDYEGNSLDNPWDFVFMIEGALFFAGSAVRRYGVFSESSSAFPFTVKGVFTGFDSPSEDVSCNFKEMWLPMWSKPAAVPELFHVFSEGRAEVNGRPARNSIDFVQAVVGLGVDRGIDGFIRYEFLPRNGESHLAIPAGRISVSFRKDVDLLRETDFWLDGFRSIAQEKLALRRYKTALWRIDNAIFDFCKYGGPSCFQNVLIAFGNAERELALGKKVNAKTKKENDTDKDTISVQPLFGLSPDWIRLSNDKTPEFRLAQAIAFIDDNDIGPLRFNLEPVQYKDPTSSKKNRIVWADNGRCVVWTLADLTTNLVQVLERRRMDGFVQCCADLPIRSKFFAPLDDIAAFLDNRLDCEKIESLIWGMILVNPPNPETEASGDSDPEKAMPGTLIPRDYALLKLLFLPRPLVADRKGQKISWRLANSNEDGIRIRQEPRILTLLRAGRIGEACALAAYRLRVSGLTPMPGPTADGRRRDWVWSYERINPRRGIRLAAAMLIPISNTSVDRLVQLVCRPETADELESMNVVTQGDTP